MALEELAPHAVTDRFRLVPGIVVALVAVAIGVGIQQFASNVSPLLSALVLGIALANVGIVPAPMWSRLRPGFTYAGRRFLRAGIVLLGLQIVMGDILGHGLRLNGQVMQDANTDDMIWGVAETISLLSDCLTLEPGDVIVMGTPAGVGQARTPPVWMKPGDLIEIEIDKIGTLCNPIVAEAV